jgi:tRNA-Thr(GGU) m(6)t(6)A37 methyltransferase TsaA
MELGEVIFIGDVKSADGDTSTIQVFDKYCDGLHHLQSFTHVIVLYWFHRRDNREHRSVLRVTPKMHRGAPEIGVFSSRSPSRPNPIGLCVSKILALKRCQLTVVGLDAEVGSPIVDIKPYLPRADAVPDAQVPSYMRHGPST